MNQTIFTRKLGMTEVFADDGARVPVTVLSAPECVVVQKRTAEADGYQAIQVGFEAVDGGKIRKKPNQGYFTKQNVGCFRILREVRVDDISKYEVGQKVSAEFLEPGDLVAVSGTSKGKGFQGVIKRHHFAGHCASHGATIHRRPGSIGMRERPGRIFPNKRMPGRMGGDRVTVRNIEVVNYDKAKHILLVRGATPGGKNALITVRLLQKKKAKAS